MLQKLGSKPFSGAGAASFCAGGSAFTDGLLLGPTGLAEKSTPGGCDMVPLEGWAAPARFRTVQALVHLTGPACDGFNEQIFGAGTGPKRLRTVSIYARHRRRRLRHRLHQSKFCDAHHSGWSASR
jgi:hypothetical protein